MSNFKRDKKMKRKFRKLLLGMMCTSSLFASMDVTIDVTGLSGPNVNTNALAIENVSGIFHGTATYYLNDGSYTVKTSLAWGMNVPYGSFDVNGTNITVTSGALKLNSNNTIGFDLGKLARIELDTTELGVDLEGNPKGAPFVAVSAANNILRGKVFVHLPDGNNYKIYTRKSDLYGTFDIVNSNVTNVEGRIYKDATVNGLIHFDKNKLAAVRVMDNEFSEPENLLLSFVQEIAGPRLSTIIVYIPPGVHNVITRAGAGYYGSINIDESLNISVNGALINKGVNTTSFGTTYTNISLDKSQMPPLDIYWSELSEPAGLVAVGINQMGFGRAGELYNRYFLPANKVNNVETVYRISNYHEYQHSFYGDMTLNSSTNPYTTGALRIENDSLHFDTCALNKVSFIPNENESYVVRRWTGLLRDTASIYAPNGASFNIAVSTTPTAPSIEVKATVVDGNLVFEGDFSGRMSVTSEVGHCTPPDVDEDGIFDESDECLDTNIGEKVDAYGCSVNQNIALSCDAVRSKNHGRYVSCVSHVLNDLIDQGMIIMEEKGQILSEISKEK